DVTASGSYYLGFSTWGSRSFNPKLNETVIGSGVTGSQTVTITRQQAPMQTHVRITDAFGNLIQNNSLYAGVGLERELTRPGSYYVWVNPALATTADTGSVKIATFPQGAKDNATLSDAVTLIEGSLSVAGQTRVIELTVEESGTWLWQNAAGAMPVQWALKTADGRWVDTGTVNEGRTQITFLAKGSYRLTVSAPDSLGGDFRIQAQRFTSAQAIDPDVAHQLASLPVGATRLLSVAATPGDDFSIALGGQAEGLVWSVVDAYGARSVSDYAGAGSVVFTKGQASGDLYILVTRTVPAVGDEPATLLVHRQAGQPS